MSARACVRAPVCVRARAWVSGGRVHMQVCKRACVRLLVCVYGPMASGRWEAAKVDSAVLLFSKITDLHALPTLLQRLSPSEQVGHCAALQHATSRNTTYLHAQRRNPSPCDWCACVRLWAHAHPRHSEARIASWICSYVCMHRLLAPVCTRTHAHTRAHTCAQRHARRFWRTGLCLFVPFSMLHGACCGICCTVHVGI